MSVCVISFDLNQLNHKIVNMVSISGVIDPFKQELSANEYALFCIEILNSQFTNTLILLSRNPILMTCQLHVIVNINENKY